MNARPSVDHPENTEVQLLCARYVVPVVPAECILKNHCVVIRGDVILDLLPEIDASRQYPGALRVDLSRHVLMPGLINMHTHSPMTLLRGIADDIELQEWLKSYIWPVEQTFVSESFVRDGTRLAIAEMLRCGTTCFNENYFFPETIAETAAEAGIRACIGIPVIDVATNWAGSADECIEKGMFIIEHVEKNLTTFSLSPHAPYTVDDAALKRIAVVSEALDLPVHMHVLESAWEIQHSLQVHGCRPLQRLERLGLMTPRLLAVHMTQCSRSDFGLLKASGANVVHCPQSNLKLANGICPVSDLIAESVNVVIGTDGAASNNNLDILSEAQTAALLAKGATGDALVLAAPRVLEMLTIKAAEALGIQHLTGSVEKGKQADLTALDLHYPESQPVYNVISQLIYAASSRQFTDTWVAGRRLLDEGRLTSLDIDSVMQSTAQWQDKISNRITPQMPV